MAKLTFMQFPKTCEGIYKDLMTMEESKLTSERYTKISDIIKNEAELARQVAGMFNVSLEQLGNNDDFAVGLDNILLKICFAVTTLTEFFIRCHSYDT